MSKASVKTSAEPADAGLTTSAPPKAGRIVKKSPMMRALLMGALKGLASLKLTVVLLALSAVLVFIGTLAQVHLGIWTVVHTYFRSLFVWVPLAVFFTPTHNMNRWLGFPYPGGWLLGTVLLVNLLAAHMVRFKISWKRTGILLIHAGLIILMLGELVTGLFAVEGQMPIEIGRATNFVTHTERKELAFVVPNAEPGKDDVVVIPGSRLRQGDGWITSPDLPCDVKVNHYMVNSALLQKPPPPDAPIHATAGAGLQYTPDERAEGAGVDSDAKVDTASAYVTLKKKGGDETLGVYLVSEGLNDQRVEIDGKKYLLSLRGEREYPGYTIELLDFRHSVYEGTDIPKDYSSRIRLTDPARGEERDVWIRMNEPLRYRGLTYYQAGTLPADAGTVLEVVRNPGFAMPYLACAMVVIGMLIHFGMSLVGFLRKRAVS